MLTEEIFRGVGLVVGKAVGVGGGSTN